MKVDRSRFLLLCASMVPVVALACGGAGDDETAGAGSAISDTPAAAPDAVTVTTKAITSKTDKCPLDLKVPSVSIPTNKAAETAINKALEPVLPPCDESGGDAETSSFEVTANADGLLSIRVTEITSVEGATQPDRFIQGYNFDVKDGGKRLTLFDVTSVAGWAKEFAQCKETVNGVAIDGGAPDDAGIGAPSDEGTKGSLDCFARAPFFEPHWVATKDGLELDAHVPHAMGDFMASTVSWKDLGTDGLTPNTVVAAFAKAPR